MPHLTMSTSLWAISIAFLVFILGVAWTLVLREEAEWVENQRRRAARTSTTSSTDTPDTAPRRF